LNKFLELKNISNVEVKEIVKNISDHFYFLGEKKSTNDSPYQSEFLKNKSLESITFFGGTFNPIHLGHLECIKLCPEKNIVVILDRNPQKELREISLLTELQTIVARLQSLDCSIYPGFWLNEKTNPTSEWILKVTIPEKNLLMGDDTFINFFSWINPDVILKNLSKIYVVPRSHQLHQLALVRDRCMEINPNLEIKFLSNHPYQKESSSNLRANTKR
jgi:nicotinate-nucleotide adenylyltransferase